MDVTQENLLETVRNIREMIKDHILPRLTNSECELADLRAITWPVCQNIIDEKLGLFATIPQKRKFLYHLDDTDAKKLLRSKGRIGNISSSVTAMEYQQIYSR